MQLRSVRIGSEYFALPFGDADEVESLRYSDPVAALALARRRDHPNLRDGSTLHVPFLMVDGMPPEIAAAAQRHFQEPTGAPSMSTASVVIGDQTVTVDARVADELNRLRQQVAARDSLPVADRLLGDARDAMLAQEHANRDPNTARGKAIARQERAYLDAGASRV